MMEYVKKDLGSFGLHLIKTDKFKTVNIRVVFRSPIKKDEITMRNILTDMFLQSSNKYNSKRELTIKAQDLYAAEIQTSNTRLGNYIFTNFYLSVLNDRYTEEGNLENAIDFLNEIIFNPDVVDGSFNTKRLDIVKNNCSNAINSFKEDASGYSLIRMAESFNANSPLSFRMCGYLEDLEKVNEKSLYEYYLKMINNDLVDIFVIGDIDIEEITLLMKKHFKFKKLKKVRTPYILDEVKARSKKLFASEVIDNSQSKIALACPINGISEYERNYPLSLYNVILGGGTDSKLFKDVREANSLCYTIRSIPNKLDNLLIIMAGIDKENFKKTVDLIDKNMLEMKKGKFSDKDINIAKEYFSTALDEILESPDRIIDNYLMMEIMGTDDIDVKREKMMQVSKNEIVKLAKKIKIDTIFCLEGVATDEEN